MLFSTIVVGIPASALQVMRFSIYETLRKVRHVEYSTRWTSCICIITHGKGHCALGRHRGTFRGRQRAKSPSAQDVTILVEMYPPT